jgi:hypothetical protein
MTKSRIALLSFSALAALTTMLAFVASFFAHPAIAIAQTVPPIVTEPPSTDANGLLVLLLQAKYMPLVGAVLVLVVKLLRTGAGAILPWFSTKAGGYAISILTTFGLYIGGTMQGGGSVDYPLIATALVMTFAAAGGWEAFRDFVMALKGSSNAAKGAATAALVIAGALGTGSAISGCATAEKIRTHANAAGQAIVECATIEKARLTEFTLTLAIVAANDVIKTGKVDWDAMEAAAWGEATAVGQCAFAAYYAATHPAGETARTLIADPAVVALERLRSKAGVGGWQLDSGRSL